MRYLRWYRLVADLAIRNDATVIGIEPKGGLLVVHIAAGEPVLARRVVIATGHDGGGGLPDGRAPATLFNRRAGLVIGAACREIGSHPAGDRGRAGRARHCDELRRGVAVLRA